MRRFDSFREFDAAVLGASKYATRDDLDRWLDLVRSDRSTSNARDRDVYPAHGGIKQPLAYQADVITSVDKVLGCGSRALVAMPTGAGKTFTAMRWLLRQLETRASTVVWVAPQRLLLEQAAEEFRAAWFTEPRGYDAVLLETASPRHTDAVQIQFATFQGLLRADVPPRADIVVVDEAHHTEANEFGGAIDKIVTADTKLVGLSATPGRRTTDEFEALVKRFNGQLIVPKSLGRQPVERLRELGVFATLRNVQLKDPGALRVKRGPEACSLSPSRLDVLVEACGALPETARTLIFCHSLSHCHVVASTLHARGLAVAVVGSEMGEKRNRAAIERFRRGAVRFLVNVKYLAVGADFPFADVAILSVPLESPLQFEQTVGRVARGPAVGGTPEAVVMDFDGLFSRHDAVQSYARFWQGWWNVVS